MCHRGYQIRDFDGKPRKIAAPLIKYGAAVDSLVENLLAAVLIALELPRADRGNSN